MPVLRIIDSNIFIYALNQSHPAYKDCSEYMEKYDEVDTLFTIPETLHEIFHILTVFYNMKPQIVLENIKSLSESNIQFESLSIEDIAKSFKISVENGLDVVDARIYYLAVKLKIPIIVTDDHKFGKFIQNRGLIWESPISPLTRKKMEEWESEHLPTKGLPRILNYLYHYIKKHDTKLAELLKTDSNYYTNLPKI